MHKINIQYYDAKFSYIKCSFVTHTNEITRRAGPQSVEFIGYNQEKLHQTFPVGPSSETRIYWTKSMKFKFKDYNFKPKIIIWVSLLYYYKILALMGALKGSSPFSPTEKFPSPSRWFNLLLSQEGMFQ